MGKKIKILFIMPRCTKSGPIQVLENIIKHLEKEKFQLYLITINEENPNRSILKSFSKGMDWLYVPVSKLNALLGNTKKLKSVIEEINPDVIHTTGFVPDLIISRMFPERQLTILHANLRMDYLYLSGKVNGAILATIHEQVLKKIGTVVACSKSLSEIYSRRGYSIPYIRNGVDCKNINNGLLNLNRKDLNIPEHATIFVYAASFNKRKNHRFLLECFSRFDQEKVLLLLGDGPTYENLKNEFSYCKNVIFRGRVENVRDYLRISDYFVSSSIQEGLPMGVIEAMFEGLPVLLSDIPQHREVWEVNPSIGQLFTLNDKNDFTKKIELIINCDRMRASLAYVETVLAYFNAEKMSKAYQEYYEKIALK